MFFFFFKDRHSLKVNSLKNPEISSFTENNSHNQKKTTERVGRGAFKAGVLFQFSLIGGSELLPMQEG